MITQLDKELAPLKEKLINHDLYKNLKTIDDIKIFMEHHVFAVWDFMSLVKKLQIELTNTSIPWTPKKFSFAGRLINEIVWAEETDVNKDNAPMSHFEMYLESMKDINANTNPISNFIDLINQGNNIDDAFSKINVSKKVKQFVNYSFSTIQKNKIHVIAAVFTFGREDLLPDLFIKLLEQLKGEYQNSLDNLIYYFKRHVELDGDEHGPMALKMISDLCGNDKSKWNESINASKQALKMRISLWDDINMKIKKNNSLAYEKRINL